MPALAMAMQMPPPSDTDPPPTKRLRIDPMAFHLELARVLMHEATFDAIPFALISACDDPPANAPGSIPLDSGHENQMSLEVVRSTPQPPTQPEDEDAPAPSATPANPAMPSPSSLLTYQKRSAIQPFDEAVLRVLTNWYESHKDLPYPTKVESEEIAREAGISAGQVIKWYANKRRRDGTVLPRKEVARRRNQQLRHARQ